mmetsp:Transcript_20341/g.48031  ORF Transcript_20341/g.48031 Transcript_20341/m.48031 type:complete len:284 (+) Transcript_20341:361-1212(+)
MSPSFLPPKLRVLVSWPSLWSFLLFSLPDSSSSRAMPVAAVCPAVDPATPWDLASPRPRSRWSPTPALPSRTLPDVTVPSSSWPRLLTSSSSPRFTRLMVAASPVVSSLTDLPVPVRPFSPRPWPVRPVYPSSPSRVPSSSRCSLASVPPVSVISSARPRRIPPASSSLMRSMPSVVSVVPVSPAATTSASRPSTRSSSRWTVSMAIPALSPLPPPTVPMFSIRPSSVPAVSIVRSPLTFPTSRAVSASLASTPVASPSSPMSTSRPSPVVLPVSLAPSLRTS